MADQARIAGAVSLDVLAANPSKATTLPLEAVPALLTQLAALQTALAARLATGTNGRPPDTPPDERLLTVREAAAALKVSPDWLYRRAACLPFAVRLGRHLRFSAAGISRYLRQRQGR